MTKYSTSRRTTHPANLIASGYFPGLLPQLCSMAWSGSDATLPFYLLIASVCNLLFFRRSLKDCFPSVTKTGANLEGGPAISLLTTAVAELTWVLPCFIQCTLTFTSGSDGWWSSHEKGSVGCNIQGFYSVFGSISGMLATLQMAMVTLRIGAGRSVSTAGPAVSSMFIILFSMIVALLPLLGVGKYTTVWELGCRLPPS